MPNTRTLDNHLTLHGWLNSHFGYKTTRDLLNDTKRFDAEHDPSGDAALCNFLSTLPNLNPRTKEKLPTYDDNINRHLSAINNKRTQPIVLRYFQYLALLYTEILLDWKFNKPRELLKQLNAFVQTRNSARAPSDAMDTNFTNTDLDKLAFWMATGAGKTLIMHINYHQFLHYAKDEETLDHIILITPNQGLSDQHIRELTNSDIRCERFNIERNRLASTHDAVQAVSYTHLTLPTIYSV